MTDNKDYMVCFSGGNDSVALLQFMINGGYDFDVVFNDTGWAADGWIDRVKQIANMLGNHGSAHLFITESEGMEALVRRKKGWPMPASQFQFCTQFLKTIPTIKLLDEIDPENEITCVNGVRREESVYRNNAPEWIMDSKSHGGRELWQPLYMHSKESRDELILQFGMDVLPHSSRECYPCVCSNKDDLNEFSVDVNKIDLIERIEISMGHTKNLNPRTMFRPYRVGNGVGIRQAVAWGCGKRGYKSTKIPAAYKYTGAKTMQLEFDAAYNENTRQGREFARQCDGGYCGI